MAPQASSSAFGALQGCKACAAPFSAGRITTSRGARTTASIVARAMPNRPNQPAPARRDTAAHAAALTAPPAPAVPASLLTAFEGGPIRSRSSLSLDQYEQQQHAAQEGFSAMDTLCIVSYGEEEEEGDQPVGAYTVAPWTVEDVSQARTQRASAGGAMDTLCMLSYDEE